MWQASSTRFGLPPPFLPLAVGFFEPMRLPIGSVSTWSNRPFISRSRIARTFSSRPGTPGASDNDLSSGRFMLVIPQVRVTRTRARASDVEDFRDGDRQAWQHCAAVKHLRFVSVHDIGRRRIHVNAPGFRIDNPDENRPRPEVFLPLDLHLA